VDNAQEDASRFLVPFLEIGLDGIDEARITRPVTLNQL
jgi:hypothetical protein